MTLIYIADAFEKEAESQEKITKLAEERLSTIQSLESQLEKEKTIKAQLEDNLNKANEKLQQLKEEKELDNRNCSEALKKVEEFKMLHDKSQERIATLEEEKSQLTATMVTMDMEKHSLSELVKEKEQQFYNSKETVAKQALKVEVATLKKVVL